jgi:hypothetical protein
MIEQIQLLQQLQTDLTARLGKDCVLSTPVLLTLTLNTLGRWIAYHLMLSYKLTC